MGKHYDREPLQTNGFALHLSAGAGASRFVSLTDAVVLVYLRLLFICHLCFPI